MHEFPDTSHSLIARVKDLGDGAAWAEFLGIYQPVVFRMARRRGLQDADAQDVMQQLFLSISRAIEGWIPGDLQPPFRAWLTTVARNAITRALTRRPRDAATGSTSRVDLLEREGAANDTKPLRRTSLGGVIKNPFFFAASPMSSQLGRPKIVGIGIDEGLLKIDMTSQTGDHKAIAWIDIKTRKATKAEFDEFTSPNSTMQKFTLPKKSSFGQTLFDLPPHEIPRWLLTIARNIAIKTLTRRPHGGVEPTKNSFNDKPQASASDSFASDTMIHCRLRLGVKRKQTT